MPALRPRLTIAGPLLHGSGELHIVGRHDVTTIHDPDGAVHRLLALADGSRSRAEIFSAMAHDFPRLAEHDVDDAVDELESIGLLQDAAPRGRILGGTTPRRDPRSPGAVSSAVPSGPAALRRRAPA
jgi:hypothetical protein